MLDSLAPDLLSFFDSFVLALNGVGALEDKGGKAGTEGAVGSSVFWGTSSLSFTEISVLAVVGNEAAPNLKPPSKEAVCLDGPPKLSEPKDKP